MRLGLGLHIARQGGSGIPSWVQPGATVDFDFANGRYFRDGSVYSDWASVVAASGATFTRASTGYRYNSSGLLVAESTDVLRFNHDPAASNAAIGVLIEPAATNLVLRSEALDNASWTKTTAGITANAVAAPDGATTADLVANNSGSSNWARAEQTVVVSSSTSYVARAFLKDSNAGYGAVRINDGSNYTVIVNLSDGSVLSASAGVTASVLALPGGWYRVDVLRTASSSAFIVYVSAATGGGSVVVANGVGVYAWGVEVKAGASSSYVKSDGTSGTRAADALSIVLPTGTHDLTFTFDDDSTQAISGQTGTYNVPTNLNRPNIKRVWSVLA